VNYALPASVTSAVSGKLVFITGSEGFLGRHFTAALREAGASVVGFDIRNGQREDVSNMKMLDERASLFEMADFVIHGAGIASPFHYRRLPLVALDAATKGTRNLLELAMAMPKRPRFLYLSSSEIYGDPAVVPTPEGYIGALDPLSPRAVYDVSKALGETLVNVYAEREGVRATIVRLFNAFGPGMADDDHRFMPRLRNAKRSGEPMHLYGDGKTTRTFNFVSDAVRGCLQALVSDKFGPFNIGNDTPELSTLEVCHMAGVPFECVPYPTSWPEQEPLRRCPDISRARRELGYEPVVSFAQGLEEFLAS